MRSLLGWAEALVECRYDGEWDGGVRSGEGKIELTDGSVYEGMFEMNQRHDPRGDGREVGVEGEGVMGV